MISKDPSLLLKAPRIEKKLPEILTTEEVIRLLEQPKGDSPKELRDKAMLELLYATGLRVSELISLKVSDVNLSLNYIECHDRTKSRIIPIEKSIIINLLFSIYFLWGIYSFSNNFSISSFSLFCL